jgi:prepilin-type processing-associated H-X9-DG protein
MKTRNNFQVRLELRPRPVAGQGWRASLREYLARTVKGEADKSPAVGQCAFTRLDLLAVSLIAAVLFLVLLPALAKPGLNSKSFQCLNNHRQLANAWRMYADDNRDCITYASTGGSDAGRSGSSVPIDSANPSDPNNFAWTGAHMDFSAVNRANWDTDYDLVRRPLWPYTARNASIYKCPSDQSTVLNLSGQLVPRIQSISMNLYLGGFTGTSGGWSYIDPYRIFLKTTELTAPSPGKTFVFIDHRPDNVNWGNFVTDMVGYAPSNPAAFTFADWPGYYHDGAAGLCFADGHTEMHRWTDPRTTPPNLENPSIASPNNPDIAWLQDHSTRPNRP